MPDFLMITSSPVLSAVISLFIAAVLLYLARVPIHRSIVSFTHALRSGLKSAAFSVMQAERKLSLRNREVLLAAERIIEREFERVDASVKKDLTEYPALHRQLNESIEVINDMDRLERVLPQ